MGFHINTPTAPSSTAHQSTNTNATNPNWRADAFLNAWIDLPGGKSIKLGAMTYKLSKKVEAQLIEMLSQPGAVENLKQHVRFDFQLAESPDAGGANMFAFLAAPTAPSQQTPSAPWDGQAPA